MSVIAMANLGNSDLQERHKVGRDRELTAAAADILADRSAWGAYDLPILRPFLQEIKFKTGQTPLLVLFTTDQVDVGPNIKKYDTAALGRLVKTWLSPEGREDFQGLAANVHLAPAIEREPQNYDLMLQWYKEHLPNLIKEINSPDSSHDLSYRYKEHLPNLIKEITGEDQARLHLSITGGTPAMNLALLFSAFGIGRVENVWHINEITRAAVPYQIGHILAGEPLRRVFQAHLERQDYQAAAELASNIIPGWIKDRLQDLAEIRRCNFSAVLGQLPRNPQVKPLRDWVELLEQGRQALNQKVATIDDGVRAIHAFQLAEIELQFKRKDYPEALAALYRLQESLLRLRFEQVTGLSGEKIFDEAQEEAWQQEMADFLASKKLTPKRDIRPGSREDQASILAQLEPDHELTKWVARLQDKHLGNRSLLALRNKSRLAHGFEAVTEQKIKQAGWSGGPEEILADAWKVAEKVLGSLQKPPYQEFHRLIIEALN